MNSDYCAYFKAHRESMGMTVAWVAEQLRVPVDQVQRYEYDLTPSNDALDFIEKWRDYFLDEVAKYVTQVGNADTQRGKRVAEVLVYRYHDDRSVPSHSGLTAAMHAALQAHIAFTLELQGRTVHVQWAPSTATHQYRASA